MTALGIRYLTGNAVAANLASPRTPEYPPHVGRVFMAMAAAHFETQGDTKERSALEWLEGAGAPEIQSADWSERSFVETYVPTNDKPGGVTSRIRQPRSFPTARPESPFVFLRWKSDIPEDLHSALQDLCAKVTRIGHSSSLAQMWVVEDATSVEPTLEPAAARPQVHLRVPEPGTLRYLEKQFNKEAILRYQDLDDALAVAKGREKVRLKDVIANEFPDGPPKAERPKLTCWQGYSQVQRDEEQTAAEGPFEPDFLIFRAAEESMVLGLPAALQMSSALRNAVMKRLGLPANIPEWISGHQRDGTPTRKPHAAYFALPFVGRDFADGHVMGVAMAIPKVIEPDGETGEESRRRVLGALLFEPDGSEKTIRLWRRDQRRGDKAWEWEGEREKRDSPPITLRAGTWNGPSELWASVTPVVLHHHPRKNRIGEVERIVLDAFQSAGFPEPADLRVQAASVFEGAPGAQAMPRFEEGGENLCQYQTHVVARFHSPVRGPFLLGRGRFRGYGLMRPWKGWGDGTERV